MSVAIVHMANNEVQAITADSSIEFIVMNSDTPVTDPSYAPDYEAGLSRMPPVIVNSDLTDSIDRQLRSMGIQA